MARIQLKFRMVSEVIGKGKGGILVLTDRESERQLVIPCDPDTLLSFTNRMNRKGDYSSSLPDVLVNILMGQTDLHLEVLFDSVKDGAYHAVLYNHDTQEKFPLKDTDGVMLNFISNGKIHMYMDEKLFMQQSTRYDAMAGAVALPINSISSAMLEEGIKNAIANEEYEMASQLSAELKRRKQHEDEEAADGADQA
jgi:bifunctional DNase/RNase